MSQTDNPAEQFVMRRIKNLEFFQRAYPGIYEFFSSYELKSSQLDILPNTNEVDLIENGQHVYGGGAHGYAQKEVAQFLSVFDYGKKINTFKPLFKGEYQNPRYFAERIEKLYQSSRITQENFTGYNIPNFFPLVVFMGCGAGLHIQLLSKQRDISNILVVETNMDRFAASLYSVDWEEIASPYLDKDGCSFTFSLIPNINNERQIRDVIWNQLIGHNPIFPVMTLYYNHMGDSLFDRVIDNINSDLYVHLLSYGNYDDELNQLNNAVHNFHKKIKTLPKANGLKIDVPVCIVGAGPSLDERVGALKEMRDSIILISCGTALRALYSHNITPDFHVELESDYNSYTTQSLMEDKSYLAAIKIIGAAQLNPLMFSLFGESRMFFKQDSGVAELFATKDEMIPHAAPTCTNAALAFVFHYGFQNIFLFGLDFGFVSKGQHHAKGTLYYSEVATEGLKDTVDYKDEQLFDVEAANGGMVQTTAFLYASKRRVENICGAFPERTINNCSNGVKLDNADWINERQLKALLDTGLEEKRLEVINFFFNDTNTVKRLDLVNNELEKFNQWLVSVCEFIANVLTASPIDIHRLTEICGQINAHLISDTHEGKNYYYFLRGSIWHFLLLAYSHGNAFAYESAQQDFLNNWKNNFLSFIKQLPVHLTSVLSKDYTLNNDAWVEQSITCMDIQALKWHYLSRSIESLDVGVENVEWKYVGYGFLDGKYINYGV